MKTRALAAALLALCGATVVLAAAPSIASAFSVLPTISCVTRPVDGQQLAYFGYVNPNSNVVSVPIGQPENYVSPSPVDRGQPSFFGPGTQSDVFAVPFSSGGSVTWTLQGTPMTASDDPSVYCGPNPTATSTSLTSSADPSVAGQMVTFTATVSPAPPNGGVVFADSALGPLCQAPVDPTNGKAVCVATYPSTGASTVSASYAGAGPVSDFVGSQAPDLEQTVNSAGTTGTATTTALASSENPVTTGQQVVYTATVSPAPDGGTVTFTDTEGATPGDVPGGCQAVPVVSGTATCTETYEDNVTPHQVTAGYSGDAGFRPSTSPGFSEAVNPVSGSGTVSPTLLCVSMAGGPNYRIAYFGYANPTSEPVSVPIEIPENYFSPPPENKGQPQTFLPGGRNDAFAVIFSSSTPITWTLDGTSVVGADVQPDAPLNCNQPGPAAQPSPASLTFAPQAQGTLSAPQTVAIFNGGTGSLAVSALSLTGADPGDFVVSASTCGAAVLAQASCQVSVRFAPQAIGARSATLQIADNDAGGPATVDLGGSGLPAPPSPPGASPGASASAGSTGGPIELLSCTVVRSHHVRARRARRTRRPTARDRCAGRAIAGTITITASGGAVRASLSRGRTVYAIGTSVPLGHGRSELILERLRDLRPGPYTLTLTRHRGRRTVISRIRSSVA